MKDGVLRLKEMETDIGLRSHDGLWMEDRWFFRCNNASVEHQHVSRYVQVRMRIDPMTYLHQCLRRRRDRASGVTGTPLYTPFGDRGVRGNLGGESLVIAVDRKRRSEGRDMASGWTQKGAGNYRVRDVYTMEYPTILGDRSVGLVCQIVYVVLTHQLLLIDKGGVGS